MAKKKVNERSLEDLEQEYALNVVFHKLYLLREVKESFSGEGITEIRRIFSPKEETLAKLNGDESFDTEAFIKGTYKERPETEAKLYHAFRFSHDSKKSMKRSLEKLQKDKKVESATQDHIATTNAIPNDPMYPQLWGIQKIQAEKVWDCSKGCDVIAAILDTGMDYNHDDLNHNMWEYSPGVHGFNFTTDNLSNPFDPMDGNGHGTHVGGTVGAEGNNNYGVIGVAPAVKLMAIKGLYNFGGGFTSDLANGIILASFLGAKVINNSWGYGSPMPFDPILNIGVNFAVASGVTLVFAAGNSNMDAGLIYPQNDDRVITVGATDSTDTKASFSNYGSKVNVTAPGINVQSSLPGNSFGAFSGTSMAAPHVTGMVALVLSKLPGLDFDTQRQIVEAYTVPYTSTEYLGTGRIDLEKLDKLLCGCTKSICDIKKILAELELWKLKNKKHKQVIPLSSSKLCANLVEGRCETLELPDLRPCFTLHWADSPRDQFETHDTETVFITVCNPFNNVAFQGLTITNIQITPNQILPNGEDSVDMIPSSLICYEHIAPCSCATREYAFITRNAAPGMYKISFDYCLEGISFEATKSGGTEFEIELIDS